MLHKKPLNYCRSDEIAPTRFVGPFDLISIIYANIQNPLCNSYNLYEVSSKSDLTWQRRNNLCKSWGTTEDRWGLTQSTHQWMNCWWRKWKRIHTQIQINTSTWSAPAHAYHVWSTSVTAIVSYPAYKENGRQQKWKHKSASLGRKINSHHR